jgi:hypothetical protein
VNYIFRDCEITFNLSFGGLFDSNTNVVTRPDSIEVVYNGTIKAYPLKGNANGGVSDMEFSFKASPNSLGKASFSFTYVYGSPLTLSSIPIGSFSLEVYDYPTVYTNFNGESIYDYFYGRTTQFPGKVEFSRTGGSQDLLYSIDGVNWKRFGSGNTLVLSPLEIQNLIPGSRILLLEPNGCGNYIMPTFGVPESQVQGGIISRSIFIDPAEGEGAKIIPGTGIHYVESGKKFAFKIFPTGPNAGKTPIVTTDRKLPIPEGAKDIETLPNEDGSWTTTIYGVQETLNVSITYESVDLEGGSTGNAAVEGSKVWGAEGVVYITSATAGSASIYSAAGTLVKTAAYTAGTTAIPLPTGFYIISASNGKYKVVVK